MIRWRYLVPRASLLAAFLLVAALGLEPLLRRGVETLGTRALGARVELAELDLAVAQLDVAVRGLAVANPADPMTNLVEFRSAELDIAAGELLHGRWRVRQGVVEGLHVATPRRVSGAVEPTGQRWAGGASAGQPIERVLGWLRTGGERLQADLEQKLRTPQLCRELGHRWPEETRQLAARCDALRRRVERLRSAAGGLREGQMPADAEVYHRLVEDLQLVRGELDEIPAEVRRLADQLRRDREAVEAARKHDLAYVRESLRVEALDRQGLTRFLLEEDQARQLEQVIAWVEWVRRFVPVKRAVARPERGQGRSFDFSTGPRPADWVCEHLRVSGALDWEGEPVQFSGQIDGLTSQQAAYGKPLRVQLVTQGRAAATVQATFDRRGAVPVDQIVLRCPRWSLPARQLGDRERLAVEIDSGEAAVELDLRLHGQQLAGALVLSQPDVALRALLPEGPSRAGLQDRVNQALAGVPRLDVRLDLGGTLRRPRCRLQSNLGGDLASGLNQALEQELQLRRDQLLAGIDARIAEEFGQLERLVQEQTQAITDQIQVPRAEIERVAASLPVPFSLPEAARLPDGFRTGQILPPEWLRR